MFFTTKPPSRAMVKPPSAADGEKLTFMVKRDVKKYLDAGKQLFDAGKLDKAIQLYKSAVKADESCALCHFNLGYAYHEQGLHHEARERYEKAIELEPTCSLFIEHMARLSFELLNYAQSANLFQRASMVGPIQPISMGLWGRALFEQGLYEQSIEVFERLLSLDLSAAIHSGANYWRTLAHIKMGNTAAARRITEEIIAQSEVDHKILFELGEHFIKVRCLSLARKIYEKIIMEREEVRLARLRLEDIRKLEEKIDALLPKLYDGDEENILHQIHALREFGNDRISKAFLSMIDSPSAPIREAVVQYQTAYGYEAEDSVRALLEDPVPYVRDAAYDYFVKLDNPSHMPLLLRGMRDRLPSIRQKTARFLGRFGTMEIVPRLEMTLEDPDNEAFGNELRKAIQSIKHRYQKTMDALYHLNIETIEDAGEDSRRDWKRALLILFQAMAVGYFLYFVITRM